MGSFLTDRELAVLRVIRDQQPYPSMTRIDDAMGALVYENQGARMQFLRDLEARGWVSIVTDPIPGVKWQYRLLRPLPGDPKDGRPVRSAKAKRKCLLCGKSFLSSHAGNRRCFPCKKLVQNRGGDQYEEDLSAPVSIRRAR